VESRVESSVPVLVEPAYDDEASDEPDVAEDEIELRRPQIFKLDQSEILKYQREEELARRTHSQYFSSNPPSWPNPGKLIIFSAGTMDYSDAIGHRYTCNCAVFAREIDDANVATPVFIIPDLISVKT